MHHIINPWQIYQHGDNVTHVKKFFPQWDESQHCCDTVIFLNFCYLIEHFFATNLIV